MANPAYETDLPDLETVFKREKYYWYHCNYAKAHVVLLGTRLRYVNGHMKEAWEHGYIISLEETLNSLLVYCVENPHKSGDIFMRDFGDGNKVNIHPAISQYSDTLVIQLYTDDLEVANPLGVHTKKHKVTPFYMVLLNVRPEDHSRLSAIHLVAIAKRVHLKRHCFHIKWQDISWLILGSCSRHSSFKLTVQL